MENERKVTTDVPVFCAFDEMVGIGKIKDNPRNPNIHPKEQVEMLAAIISNGWRAPITISTRSGLIVRGHGRLLAAKKLGLSVAPVDWQDYQSEAEELADLLADNKIPELAVLDSGKALDILAEIGTAGMDLSLAAFGAGDIEKLQVEQAMLDETESGKQAGSKWGVKQSGFTVKPVIRIEDSKVFEDAIRATGERNRGLAIIKICEAFLEKG